MIWSSAKVKRKSVEELLQMTSDVGFDCKRLHRHLAGVEDCKSILTKRDEDKLEKKGFVMAKLGKQMKVYTSSPAPYVRDNLTVLKKLVALSSSRSFTFQL